MITDNHLTSSSQTDQIIGVLLSSNLGTISTPASSTSTTVFASPINDTCLFEGRFKVTGIEVWTPIGAWSFTSAATSLISPHVSVVVKTTPQFVTVYVLNGSSSTQVIDFEIVLLSKTNQTGITPGSFVSENSFDSTLNYLKIADQNLLPGTIASVAGTAPFFSRTTFTIPHTLTGIVPMIKVWVEYGGQIAKATSDLLLPLGIEIGVFPSVNTSNLYIDGFNYPSGISANPSRQVTFHYRIFYDN